MMSKLAAKFSKQFKILNQHLEAARVQGFYWGESVYTFSDVPEDENGSEHEVAIAIDEQTYLSLALRYKELAGKFRWAIVAPVAAMYLLTSVDI